MSGKCYITGAGLHYFRDDFKPADDDLVIAADGGYIFHSLHNIRTDIIIGDFDSLADEYASDAETVIRLNPVKDETDMLSAVNTGIEKGYTEFHLFGATGGRGDHTFANIQVLNYLASRNMKGYIYAENEVMTVIRNSSLSFDSSLSGYISVFALDSECTGVTEKGLKYEIENAVLNNTFPLGVSNEFCGTEAQISVEKGALLIYYPRT